MSRKNIRKGGWGREKILKAAREMSGREKLGGRGRGREALRESSQVSAEGEIREKRAVNEAEALFRKPTEKTPESRRSECGWRRASVPTLASSLLLTWSFFRLSRGYER